MSDEKKFTKIHELEEESLSGDDIVAESSDEESMSRDTAKVVIGKHIRKKLMEEYELQVFKDAGRYFIVKARSKDGKWLYELMVDKQSEHVTISDQKSLK